jgi:hypothetical protein
MSRSKNAAHHSRRTRVWHRIELALAAKGTRLLGVRAVVAASFERIHRSNWSGWACSRCSSCGRNKCAIVRLGGLGSLQRNRPFGVDSTGQKRHPRNQAGQWGLAERAGEAANRYPDRDRLLPPRRNPSVCLCASYLAVTAIEENGVPRRATTSEPSAMKAEAGVRERSEEFDAAGCSTCYSVQRPPHGAQAQVNVG